MKHFTAAPFNSQGDQGSLSHHSLSILTTQHRTKKSEGQQGGRLIPWFEEICVDSHEEETSCILRDIVPDRYIQQDRE